MLVQFAIRETPNNTNQKTFQRSSLTVYPTCSFCEFALVPPIYVSRTGESLCSQCHARRSKEDHQHMYPNRSLEALLKHLTTACPYSRSGCSFWSSENGMIHHISSCPFRPHLCPEADCPAVSATTEILLEHLDVEHDIKQMDPVDPIFEASIQDRGDTKEESWAMTVRSDFSYFLVRVVMQQGIFKVSAAELSRVGSQIFTCTIHENSTVQFKCHCQHITSAFSQSDWLWVPYDPDLHKFSCRFSFANSK
jgi:Sina, zinc finger